MTIDESNKPKNPGGPKKDRGSELNEVLLRSLKSRSGKGTTNWLADLTQTALDGEAEESASGSTSTSAAAPADMVTVVDKIFDLLARYIYEFNKSVAGTDLSASSERPVFLKEGDHRYGTRGGAAFSGRVYMRFWSLVIRGQNDKIEGYMLPSEQVLAFNADPENPRFERFLLIEAPGEAGSSQWRIGGKDVEIEQLPTLAKLLLTNLVRVARGEASYRDPFVWTGTVESLAHGGQRTTDEQAIEAIPDHPKQFMSGEGLLSPGDASDERQFAAALDAQPGAPQSKPASEPDRSSNLTADQWSSMSTDAATISVPEAFEIMEQAIDHELEALASDGAKAFQDQDMAAAEKTLKRTTRLKAFRERVKALLAEWQAFALHD